MILGGDENNLKFRRIIFFVFAFLMIFMLCSCAIKEHRQRSEIILIRETSEIVAENKTETVSDITENKEMVYYTKTGKRYHYLNKCGRGTYYECTLAEAIQKGLSPCDKCVK